MPRVIVEALVDFFEILPNATRQMMSDVTRILDEIRTGQAEASATLLPLVYDELRRLAASHMSREAVGHTLSATALVHEAYLRLVGQDNSERWDSRGHFFGAAAQAMRRILIENARRKGRLRRGGDQQRVELNETALVGSDIDDELLAVHESLERLAQVSPEKARLVELRYFAGLSSAECAAILGVSKTTADRHWAFARAWLQRDINQ